MDRKRSEFLAQAGQAFDRMFGGDGQKRLAPFAEREERACEVTDELARRLMSGHIALDPAGGRSVEAVCPICGGPARYASAAEAERERRAAWAGQVHRVQALLRSPLERLGPAPAQAPADHPSHVVAATLGYVTKNADRMNYPQYRREGLPVTRAPVESLVKQINRRIKGTEKFWARGGVESVLQVRAAYLSDDGRGEAFHAHRPRGRLRPAA